MAHSTTSSQTEKIHLMTPKPAALVTYISLSPFDPYPNIQSSASPISLLTPSSRSSYEPSHCLPILTTVATVTSHYVQRARMLCTLLSG
jgi:hypothetical protein